MTRISNNKVAAKAFGLLLLAAAGAVVAQETGGDRYARALAEAGPPASPTEAKRTIIEAVRQVAALLGNTPAVCRTSYIHPLALELYAKGRLGKDLAGAHSERALLKLLDQASN